MDKIKFKRLLFNVACGAVSCDGDIDEREIRELKHIDKSTAYFDDIDLSNDLDRFFENFKDDSGKTIDDVISKLQYENLNPVQEMLILEVSLRLIYADTVVHEKEKEYIQKVRSCLDIQDELIKDRFGDIDFLFQSSSRIKTQSTDSLSMRTESKKVDMESLESMYANFDKKNKD